MLISYDEFTSVFLDKIKEYEFLDMPEEDRTAIIDGYMHRAFTEFKKNRRYDFTSTRDDENRQFDFSGFDDKTLESLSEDLDELINIISDGMVLQWLKPYRDNQEILENYLNTRDFTSYSPAELLKQVRTTYYDVRKEYIQSIREYSYNHMKLEELHL